MFQNLPTAALSKLEFTHLQEELKVDQKNAKGEVLFVSFNALVNGVPVLDDIAEKPLDILRVLAQSTHAGAFDLYTCQCGEAECVGFKEQVRLETTDSQVRWRLPKTGYGQARDITFDKAEYLQALELARKTLLGVRYEKGPVAVAPDTLEYKPLEQVDFAEALERKQDSLQEELMKARVFSEMFGEQYDWLEFSSPSEPTVVHRIPLWMFVGHLAPVCQLQEAELRSVWGALAQQMANDLPAVVRSVASNGSFASMLDSVDISDVDHKTRFRHAMSDEEAVAILTTWAVQRLPATHYGKLAWR